MDMKVSSAGATARVAQTMGRALEARDASVIGALYAPDCEHVLINRNSPPSRPTLIRGRAAIEAALREDCARDMVHRVESCVAEDDRFALHVSCLYPDGTRVASMIFAELENGLIRRETSIDCWDE